VLAHRISIALDAGFRVEGLEEVFERYGLPEIVNTDQGSQFTRTEFLKPLTRRGIRISMDGKGAWRDNVFVERLWRTVKYEEVYLKVRLGSSGSRVHQTLSGVFKPPGPPLTQVCRAARPSALWMCTRPTAALLNMPESCHSKKLGADCEWPERPITCLSIGRHRRPLEPYG
jgi:transposase InsO family protein